MRKEGERLHQYKEGISIGAGNIAERQGGLLIGVRPRLGSHTDWSSDLSSTPHWPSDYVQLLSLSEAWFLIGKMAIIKYCLHGVVIRLKWRIVSIAHSTDFLVAKQIRAINNIIALSLKEEKHR